MYHIRPYLFVGLIGHDTMYDRRRSNVSNVSHQYVLCSILRQEDVEGVPQRGAGHVVSCYYENNPNR